MNTKAAISVPDAVELSAEELFDLDNFQEASRATQQDKYALHSPDGSVNETTYHDMYKRVTEKLVSVEKPKLRRKMRKEFMLAFELGAICGGRIMSNAGAELFKPATSTINCTVSGTIQDSLPGIMNKLSEAIMTLQAGCGIGYEFSTLRPLGAYVNGAGAETSGPLSFMDMFDVGCGTIMSAGGRRGAQMGTMDVQHPDIEAFISEKRKAGKLRRFNLSVLITDAFVRAVKDDAAWPLVFPTDAKELERAGLDLNNPAQIYWREWPLHDAKYIVSDDGLVACRIYRTVQAKALWDLIMESTFNFWEPGFILIDHINRMNNLWFCENIRATNPCGEQPLPEYGACLLGSINLIKFVVNPFTPDAYFDWKLFGQTVRTFARMLDNVVEFNGLPLRQQREEIMRKRRHGMGYLGLGSACSMMGMTYGSNSAVSFTAEVSKQMALENWKAGLELAKEKGAAPIMDEMFTVTGAMLRQRPQMVKDGIKVGDQLPGRVLMIAYSEYMKRITAELGEEWTAEALQHGLRFTHATSIAPTGTISFALANNASNGIEPTFSHETYRAVIVQGKKTKMLVKNLMSAELFEYRRQINPNATAKDLPEWMVAADDVTPEQHVAMQAAAQPWIDSAISKTANCPADMDFDDFKDIYMLAYESGLKGFTTYRPNPDHMSGVLNTYESLSRAQYQFTLDDGTVLSFSGLDDVEYDGEIHNAAMLSDAIREGTYATF